MSAEYTKVYSQFWNSSLADAPPFARLLFLALLSMADEHGEITATMSAIARFANLPIEDVEQAMEILQAPDPDSTSPDHDGRRILRDGNHWLVVNYAKYYERGRNEDRKEYKRNWDREHADLRHKSHKTRQNPTEPDKPDLEKKRKEKKALTPLTPQGDVPDSLKEIWDDWITYRRERKLAAYKPTTVKKQIAFLLSQPNPRLVVDEAIRNNWQGLFPVGKASRPPLAERHAERLKRMGGTT